VTLCQQRKNLPEGGVIFTVSETQTATSSKQQLKIFTRG
jgi:hypothetical protein